MSVHDVENRVNPDVIKFANLFEVAKTRITAKSCRMKKFLCTQ